MIPDDPVALAEKGHKAHASGDLRGAAHFFARALEADPDDLSLRMALAETLMATGNAADAAALLEGPAETHPLLVPLLAESLIGCGRRADAAARLERHLSRRPSGFLHHRLADLLAGLGHPEEARTHYAEAMLFTPQDAGLLTAAAAFHLAHGWLGPALDLAQRALRCDRPPAGLHLLLGDIWARMAEPQKALQNYRRHKENHPEEADLAEQRIAALEETPDLSPDFVRGVFDQYAEKFDSDLTKTLQYRGPLVVAQALAPFLAGIAPKSLSILDLGCGTGLSGEPFATLAARMDGCDLSPRMLEKAAARGIYTHLSTDDFLAALRHGTWDLVLAVDAFVYIGKLEAVFSATAETLNPGGLLAATFEAGPDSGFLRKPCKRFGHAETYLRETATACGLDVLALDAASSRMEKRVPVNGFVMVCRKRP